MRTRTLRPAGGARASAVLAGLLALATLAVFSGALRCGFVHDDRSYVLQNPGLALGFTARGLAWAFTSFHASNWHPLTWLSHMADVALFGWRPAGHHATSLLLHAASALLLALVLRRATGRLWPSLWAAAAFALHPLRVESVAWVAERKDVLSVLLALATLAAYLRHVRRPAPGRYLAVVGAFAAGLLAKPMLVALPLALLLFDVWPLGRLLPRTAPALGRAAWRLVVEKLPLLALAAGSAALTVAAQKSGGALVANPAPLADRAANAAVSLAFYLGKTVWPAGLAVFYPLPPHGHPAWKVAGALVLLAAISAVALATLRRRPWFAFGWLWFLLALAPVLGFVQFGLQAAADRYTYLPHLGLAVAVAWQAADAGRAGRRLRGALPAVALAVLGALAVTTVRQVGFWRSELTLYGRNAAVEPESWFARYNHGVALDDAGRLEEAAAEYLEVLRLYPRDPDARTNLGRVRQRQGRLQEAAMLYRESIGIKPRQADTWNNLAGVLAAQGQRDEAVRLVREALRIDPNHALARENLRRLRRGTD